MKEAIPPIYDPVCFYGIISVAVCTSILWVGIFSQGEVKRARILAFGLLLVMGLSAALALSGKLSRFDVFPPPIMALIVLVLVLSFGIGCSPFGRGAAQQVSFTALVGLQTFRLPLELVMHRAAELGIMPPQLSYSGFNFDIVTGIGALLLLALLESGRNVSKSLLWLWNIWGIYSLVVIILVAVTTSPVLRLFGDNPHNINTWVLYFPYVWVPAVLVSIAISSHIIVTRKLLLKA